MPESEPMRFKFNRAAIGLAGAAFFLSAAPQASAQMLVHLASVSVSTLYAPAAFATQYPAWRLPGALQDHAPENRFGFNSYSPQAPGDRAGDRDGASRFAAIVAAPERLFGGVEIRVGKTVHAQTWDRLLQEKANSYFAAECGASREVCESPARRMIAAATAKAASEEPRQAIHRINAAVNRAIRFTPDIDQYAANDHWASAAQTLRSGRGDCEDYAIMKYWALASIGVPMEAMRLVIVRDVRRRLDHAVLALSLDGENLILDSLSNNVRSEAAYQQYEPRLSLAADGAWVHGRYRPQVARADISQSRSR